MSQKGLSHSISDNAICPGRRKVCAEGFEGGGEDRRKDHNKNEVKQKDDNSHETKPSKMTGLTKAEDMMEAPSEYEPWMGTEPD